MSRTLLSALAIALAGVAQAQIDYTVQPNPADNTLRVSLTFSAKSPETAVQMPRWAPGAYILSDPSRNVRDLVVSVEGEPSVAVTKSDEHTWRFPTPRQKKVTVTYSLPAAITDETVHFSGPSTYLYVVGRKEEPCTLAVPAPPEWRVAVGLDPIRSAPTKYTAKDYDVLADNPVTVGKFLEDTYTVDGKPHFIVLRNPAKSDVDREYLKKACRFITETQRDFFGGLPYNRYVWHFAVGDRIDGAGGLEHLSSTQITLPSGVGPGAVGVLAHEFFHLWNVKRIRSRALGPFDYTQLPKTGALWFLEGTTDYYAHLLLYRNGWNSQQTMFADILDNLRRQRSRPARLEVSPHEASMRVGEAAGGRGNSDGYRVSYYDTGFLVGLCLDIEMLSLTGGKRSLDDVTLALWNLTKDDKPGFQEDEIRKRYARFGGPEAGEFYDQVVMRPGELPVEAQLQKVGLELTNTTQTLPTLGFAGSGVVADRLYSVRAVTNKEAWPELREGDLIREINGVSLDGATNRQISSAFARATKDLKPGDTLNLKVIRRGSDQTRTEVALTGKVGSRTQEGPVIRPLANATAEQRRLLALWAAKKRK